MDAERGLTFPWTSDPRTGLTVKDLAIDNEGYIKVEVELPTEVVHGPRTFAFHCTPGAEYVVRFKVGEGTLTYSADKEK
jgi:hypothetical protein